jgi:hypothetical protein
LTEPACVLGHVDPVEAFIGYACKRHYHHLGDTLREIETLAGLLDAVLLPGPGGSDVRVSGGGYGSPAPGRLAVMAITDARAKTPIDLDEEGAVPDMPGTLASWARIVVEERATTDLLTGDVSQSVRVLRRERKWIAAQAWLDDYAFELVAVHRALAAAVGDTMWPRPVGKCPNCGAPLFNTIGLDEIHCRRCKSTWTGVHLARLRLIHDQEAR